MRKLVYPILFVIVGMMFSSMTATQAIPVQATFNACVKKSSGAMRIVSASKKCAKKERKISWNAPGIQGPQGLQGEPGPAGQDGANGEDGQDGQDGADGGYEVLLHPADFATYTFSTLSSLEPIYSVGLPRNVWAIQNAAFGVETIMASFAAPSSWAGASTAKVTVYWIAENNSGSVNIVPGGVGQVINSPISGSIGIAGGFSGVPVAGALLAAEGLVPIGTNPDFIDVSISRYMNNGVDTNTGDIYILGAKVEPVFE